MGQIQARLTLLSGFSRFGGKQPHHRVASHARALAAHAQAVFVGQLFHLEPVRALQRHQARDTACGCIASAHDRVATAIQHGDQAHAALTQGAHLAPARGVQHIAADVRQAGQHHHHLKRLAVGLQARFSILALARRAVELRLHLAVATAKGLHQFGDDQLVETQAVKLIIRAFGLG